MDIKLNEINIDNMNLQDILKQTSSFDSYRYEVLKNKYSTIYSNNPNRFEYFKDNLESWEKDFILGGILKEEIIEKNKNRQGFFRDREFVKDGKKYEDEWFSTFMLSFSKIIEEGGTLAFLNTLKDKPFEYVLYNPTASDIDDTKPINAEPDFIYIFDSWKVGFIEQKCVYKDNFTIKLRDSQLKIFNNFENLLILIKQENYTDKDIYYFYKYEDIKEHLHTETQVNGRVSYCITKQELDNLNIECEKIIDEYVTNSEKVQEEKRRNDVISAFVR